MASRNWQKNKRWQRIIKFWLIGIAGILLLGIASTAGCSTATLKPGNTPLPAVSPVSAGKLPDWIEQISPTGEAKTNPQIRIRFKEPLIPVESLDSDDQRTLLSKFELLPPLPGQFRFLTPRMVGFQADQAIPKATRVKVTLKAGLADLKNHRLDKDFAWTFNTESIQLTDLPGTPPDGASNPEEPERFNLKPLLKLTSNVELDLASLKEHVQLVPADQQKGVSLKISQPEKKAETAETATPEEQFDPALKSWIYTVEPQQPLEKATRYRLEVTPGVKPAGGNLASEKVFASQIETYAPLAFQSLKDYGKPDAGGAYGRFVNGAGELQFNNGLELESAIANIRIQPEPKKDIPPVRVYQGDRVINLNPWALEPNTSYSITIGDKLKDVFGQTLGKAVTVKYTPSDISPDIWAPSGLNIFPTGKNLQLNISTVNLTEYKSAFKVVQPKDLVYIGAAEPDEKGSSFLPNPSAWESAKISSSKNQPVDVNIPVQQKLGGSKGMLAYGVQARTNAYTEDSKEKWREPTLYGMVQLTNLGVFAQWFPEAGMVRVHHLSDGAVVANASVQIYQSKLGETFRLEPFPCAEGSTDKTGTLSLSRRDLQKCIGSQVGGFSEAPKLLVIAQEGDDWAFTRTNEYSGAYEYGISAGWQSTKPVSRGVIFSDRQLYQPGETANFTGTAYYLQNGALQQDKKVVYSITLEGPNGQKIDLGEQTTNEFGTFSLQWAIAKSQPLGYYTLRAKSEAGVQITGEFRVAEFKPPNFKVELTLSRGGESRTGDREAQKIALPEQSLEATTQSNYLFGSPVEGGKVDYFVTRQQTEFIPKGWEEFAFGRKWFWPQEAPEVASDVLQAHQVMDAQGASRQTIKVDKDLPFPMRYRVDAQVSDVSNLTVADSQSFLALPSDRLIGLKTDFVAEANKVFPVQIIVSDPQGGAIANQKVRLELQQMIYSRIGRLVEGSRTDENQVEFKTVATTEVQSGDTPQTVSLTTPTSGSYRIRATFADKPTEVNATDAQIWVTGDSAAAWGSRYTNNRLEIHLDKATYRPGETATALIQSPYPEADLYFAVVRHNSLYRSITKVKGGAPRVQFKVTSEMVPNAAVEAVLVRQGKPLAQVEPGSLDNLVRIGFAPFKTNLDDQYLKVETSMTPTLQPGAEQTVQLTLKDRDGAPKKGQFTVMVVNEAVLQLSGYRPPDLVKTVYAEQAISTRLGDNRPDVVLQPQASPIQKGWGYGGGFSAGAGNTRTRTDFRALAYYNGSVLTDTNGKASLSFKLPDDLTTWRIMTVATDGNLHFGNGDATFITTKPLISNPLLPQFARPGDRLQLGVSVTNTTGQNGTLTVNGSVTEPLQWDNTSGNQQGAMESGTRAYRFPVVVQRAGEAKIKFATQLNDKTDAFEVPLAVKPLAIMEQVIESGTTEKEAKIPLNVDKNVAPDVGGLELNLSSTLIPTIAAPAQQVSQESELPFLEPAASQLAIAASLQSLSQTYGQVFANFNLTQQATQALERIQKLQRGDGGFAAFPDQDRADPFITPYAAQSIAQAIRAFEGSQESGAKGDSKSSAASPSSLSSLASPASLSSLKAYLKKLLADPGQYDFCKETLCKAQVRLESLIALAELGDRQTNQLSNLYDQRNQLDPISQLKLARYLSQTPGWESEGEQLAEQIRKMLHETGRSITVNLSAASGVPRAYRWTRSATIAQAEALRLFIAQKARPETLDKLLQGLVSQQRQGTWQSTYGNAQALAAVVAYANQQPIPPNFEATAQLAGKQLVKAQFAGYKTTSSQTNVAIADLPRDRQDLVLKKSGRGILHYLVAYRYRLQGNQPGRFNGLRVTRTIGPANQNKLLYRNGLFSPNPLQISVGQVFDVGLEVITDHPVDYVVITDPLPAGFEVIDNSFQTSTPYYQARGDSWQLGFRENYRDRVVALGDRLEPGVYTLHYLVRSVTPGTFVYPGAEAHLQYAPEEFGRSASSTLVVTEK